VEANVRYSILAPVVFLFGTATLHADSLMLANVAMRAHTIVYDLPGVPPDQVRSIAAAFQQKFPQAETIDAATAGESQIREKLRKTFLLVTLLDSRSRLLPLVTQSLPLKVEAGTVRWDEFSAPADGLRADFIGRNPYGAGYAAVTAVGSTGMLQGGDNGRYSYCIRNSEGVLRKGTYDEEFTPTTPDRVKLEAARADVREFFSTLERVHVDPFARVSEKNYQRMKDETFRNLDARVGADGQVSREELAYVLRYAAAFIRDGHTEMGWGVNSIYQEPMDGRRFPPFRFEFENGRFYITGASDSSLAGLELVAVNGAPTAQFLGPALDRIAGEILTWRATRLASTQDFWMWFTNLAGKTEGCCKLRLRDPKGVESDRELAPVTMAQYRKIQVVAARKVPPRNGTQVRFFDSGRVAQFIYPAFQPSFDEFQKIGNIFRQIRESKSEDVVVDLRGNGGGDVLMGSLIFSHLSPKPVPQFTGGRIKISPEAFGELFSEIAGTQSGKILAVSDVGAMAQQLAGIIQGLQQLPKQSNPFTGRAWLLVDHRSFSAANIFSAAFRDHKIGTILGYETGQPTDICGDPVVNFSLKNSGIGYRVAASINSQTNPAPGAVEHGILPDVPFDRKMLAAFHDDADPEMAAALDYIRKHR
jgi:hypothetical protein